MKLAPDDDFVLRVVQLSELLAIRHCVFLMGPTGCGRTECYRVRASWQLHALAVHSQADMCMFTGTACDLKAAVGWAGCISPTYCPYTRVYAHSSTPQVLARAIAKGTAEPVNDYLKMTNKKKVTVRDIDPKAVSTQELYGFVNMSTREWKVRELGAAGRLPPKLLTASAHAAKAVARSLIC